MENREKKGMGKYIAVFIVLSLLIISSFTVMASNEEEDKGFLDYLANLFSKITGFATQNGTVTLDVSSNATIILERIYPQTDLNVSQNEFFNITLNVTCLNDNCGDINVSFDPENDYVYSGSGDETVRKIDSKGNEIWNFTGHSNYVNDVAVDSNEYVYSASDDNTVRKIDKETGEQEWVFEEHSDSVRSLSIGKDHIYSGGGERDSSADNSVRKIDKETGEQVWSFTEHTRTVMAVVNDENYVYSTGKSDKYSTGYGDVRKIDKETGEQVWRYEVGSYGEPLDILLDGDYVFIGTGASTSNQDLIKLEKSTGNEVWSYSLSDDDEVQSILVDDYYAYGATRKSSKIVKLNKTNGNHIWDFTNHSDSLWIIKSDDDYLYSGSEDNTVRKIDKETGEQVWSFSNHSDSIKNLVVKNDYIYSGSEDNTVRKVDSSGNEVWNFTGHSNYVNDVAVDSDDGGGETESSIIGECSTPPYPSYCPDYCNSGRDLGFVDNNGKDIGEMSFEVDRDRNDLNVLGIKNRGNESAEDVRVVFMNITNDQEISVIGSGSEANSIDSIGPGDYKNITIGANLEDAMSEEINATVKIKSCERDFNSSSISFQLPECNENNYNVSLNKNEWDVNITNTTDEDLLCSNARETFEITNNGNEPISDLSVKVDDSISDKVSLSPSLGSVNIQPGESEEFQAMVLVDNSTSDFSGYINITGGCIDGNNFNKEILVNYTKPEWELTDLPPTEEKVYTDTQTGFICVNRPSFTVDFNKVNSEIIDQATNANISIGFEDSCNSVQPHNTYAYFNDELVWSSIDKVPEGAEFGVLSYIQENNELKMESDEYVGSGHYCANAHNTLTISVSGQDGGEGYRDTYDCAYCTVQNVEYNETTCSDGVDYNCNGLTDCEEPNCQKSDNSTGCVGTEYFPTPENFSEETCSDGIDNDYSGLVDCNDPRCCSYSACSSEPECVEDYDVYGYVESSNTIKEFMGGSKIPNIVDNLREGINENQLQDGQNAVRMREVNGKYPVTISKGDSNTDLLVSFDHNFTSKGDLNLSEIDTEYDKGWTGATGFQDTSNSEATFYIEKIENCEEIYECEGIVEGWCNNPTKVSSERIEETSNHCKVENVTGTKIMDTSLKGGLISTTTGDTPFYTNLSNNPHTINLEEGESKTITAWVNATGDFGEYVFFEYANLTDNMSISNKTGEYVVAISDDDAPSLTIDKNTTTVEYNQESISIDWEAADNNLDSVEFNVTYPNNSLVYESSQSRGSISLDEDNLTETGTYNIHLWANDTESNSDYETDSFEVEDTTDPSIDIKSPENKSYEPLTEELDFNVSVSDESSIDSCDYSLNGEPNVTMDQFNSTYFYKNNVSIQEGSNNVEFYCNDSEGNTGSNDLIFTINQTQVSLELVKNEVDFGDLKRDQSSADSTGLLLNNTGNVPIDVTINATDLWDNSSNPTSDYMFKIDNQGASNVFNSSTLTSWTNMPSQETDAIYEFNYTSGSNQVAVPINITVPSNEGLGSKNSDVVFTASVSE